MLDAVPAAVGVTPLQVGYVGAFVSAAVACLWAAGRARRQDPPDLGRGFAWFLGLTAAWAVVQAAYVLAPADVVASGLGAVGLTVGFATVGGWLYVCSAATGRAYHRSAGVRRAAVVVFLVVAAAKLTNPLHGHYFTTSLVASPFPHYAIRYGTVHWLTAGLAYVLAAVGFALLAEAVLESDHDAGPLAWLAVLAGLPALLTVGSQLQPSVLVALNYEPLGVAAFAVGVVVVAEDRFLHLQPAAVHGQVLDDLGTAVVVVDRAGVVRDANEQAKATFPALSAAAGSPFEAVLPAFAGVLDEEERVVEADVAGDSRSFLASQSPVTVGPHEVGTAVVCSDVTALERHRRELDRQNEQLEDLAAAITHELRNALNIVDAYVREATRAVRDADGTAPHGEATGTPRGDRTGEGRPAVGPPAESLATAADATERMERLVARLARVARHGRTVEETTPVPFRAAVEEAWAATATHGMELVVEADGVVEADQRRLVALFGYAFEFARANGATTVRVECTDDGFVVADDGDPVPGDALGHVFEYGAPSPAVEGQLALPGVRTLARVHGWTVGADPDYEEGARIVVHGADVTRER
jgi:signal transduction histidine kinase